ncbi:MAG: arylsulfatase A-like enzyme [Saprospiraceae bacterium]|jgi:arylsulfatase A-like enzyme
MNILLVTADQWRGDCLSALDHPCVKTPNFDQLVVDGVLFKNHYSVCAPCAPARASLLTGMYQQNHRVVRNGTPLDARHTNLAKELRLAGYTPTLFGYTDTSLDPRVYSAEEVLAHGYENIMPGFEEGLLLKSECPEPWLQHLRDNGYAVDTVGDAYQQQLVESGNKPKGRCYAPTIFKEEHSQTAFLTDELIKFIGGSESDWCVHLSYLRPHPPFIAPEPWNSMYTAESVPTPSRATDLQAYIDLHPWMEAALSLKGDWFENWIQHALESEDFELEMRQIRASYYGLISKVDHYFGKLIQHLKDLGQYDNTLIVLTSDHGELLGDQWLFGKRGFFDSAYHIPLIIKEPQQSVDAISDQSSAQTGRIESGFTESVDVMPTLLDLIGQKIPRQCDGRSLLPIIHQTRSEPIRTELHWEYDFREVDHTELENSMGLSMDDCHMNVIRDQHYKYVHFSNLPPLFFDLKSDPEEVVNLANDPNYAVQMLRLSQKMLSWRMQNDERTLTNINISTTGISSRE